MNNYEVKQELGKGGFGRALLARRKADGMDVVIKETLGKGPEEVAAARGEADLLKKMHHPYIVACYDTFEEGGNFYIVCEYATGDPGDLMKVFQQITGDMPEAQVVNYLRMLCSALSHCHHQHVVHRDIKPANIFLMKDGSIKLGDFGIGRSVQATMAFAQTERGAGTLVFSGPELLSGGIFSNKTDIWAVGIMCYWLLTCKLPFANAMEILTKQPDPLPAKISPGFRQLIMNMLSKDPRDRPSAMQIEASPLLCPLKVICWRDPRVRGKANDTVLRQLQAKYSGRVTLIAAETNNDAGEVIDISDKDQLWVITNRGDGGPEFIQMCRQNGVKNQILVFCGALQGWVPMPGVTIDNKANAVEQFIEQVVLPAPSGQAGTGRRGG